jgi:hypothetical protein
MRSLTVLAFAVAAALSPFAQAQKPAEMYSGSATAPGKGAAAAAITATAKVEAVDAATRTVRLKFANGDTRSVVAGDEVKNFDKIKVGDSVKMTYAEAVTLELKKDGKVMGRTESKSIERAKPGENPAAVTKRTVTATAEVTHVDADKKIVSVKTAKGEVVDLPISDPEQLKLVKKGDKVQATYTQALAVALEPAAAAPAAPKK